MSDFISLLEVLTPFPKEGVTPNNSLHLPNSVPQLGCFYALSLLAPTALYWRNWASEWLSKLAQDPPLVPGEARIWTYCSLSFLFIYLFIFRERTREGERERNINVWLPPAHLHQGPSPQPRHVPWLGIELATRWLAGQHSIHWATPARDEPIVLLTATDDTLLSHQ